MDFKNSAVSNGGHFEYCSIKKKCSTCPRWHQADFSLVGYTLPENTKKTSVMSQNEVELKKGTFPLNYNT